VRLPWDKSLSGHEKVWFVVYDPHADVNFAFRKIIEDIIVQECGQIDVSWK
jgi:hypothetical protein